MELSVLKTTDCTPFELPRKSAGKLGILGGSFNPPHLGHDFLAHGAYLEFALDTVLILPAGQPPHKPTLMFSKEERLDMCRIFADYRDCYELSEAEAHRGGATYTIDTLKEIKENSDFEIYYIVGSDTLCQLENWHEFRKVAKLATFICFIRSGDLPEEVHAEADRLTRDFGFKILFSIKKAPNISSTQIRNMLELGENIDEFVLPGVAEYIVGTRGNVS